MRPEMYMKRCLDLASLGLGKVAPNPMVGAVLVYEDKVIGEGFHGIFGESHAEVNAINDAIKKGNIELIDRSTLYVCLEPCSHYGKTPPCTELIIQHKIPKVVIGCRDPFPEVNGKGIAKLKAAGIEVLEGVMEDECKELNKRFIVFQKQHRPFIILKWAETADKFLAPAPSRAGAPSLTRTPDGGEFFPSGKFDYVFPPSGGQRGARLLITNDYTNRLVHKWRSEEAAILIGTKTALTDDPQLTNRLWKGKNPVRLVVDMELKLPTSSKIFNNSARTIIFNKLKHEEVNNLLFYQVQEDVSLVQQVLNALYQMKIQSVIVEGGARLLQSFIDEDLWDEARLIRNEEMIIRKGLPAPTLVMAELLEKEKLAGDRISIFKRRAS